MTREQTDRSTTRMLERVGIALTVYNWTDDGTTDDYGDPDFTRSDTSATGIVNRVGQPVEFASERGESVIADTRIWVDDAVSVHGLNDGSNERKSTHIKRDGTGTVYKVVTTYDEGNGLVRCWCRELPDYDLS